MRAPRTQTAIILALISAVIALAAWAIIPKQPRYKGKTLTAWVAEYDIQLDAKYNQPVRPQKKLIDEAVAHFGTNSFPVLLRMLWSKDTALTDRIVRLGANIHLRIPITPAWQSNWRAVMAFDALGSRAKDAVPALVTGLSNSNSGVRANAARALAAVRSAPELAVNALTSSLSDTNDQVRTEALTALQSYGRSAAAASPTIQKMLSDPNENIKAGAGRALWAIDPEAARKAGIP